MQLRATIANTLWTASNLPAYWRFGHALANPRLVQQQKLRQLLRKSANTEFGKAHRFDTISNYEEFTRRVPISDYTAFAPWIDRICRGETNILTRDRVTHLIPTSGSSGAQKLIPFTSGLQSEFNAAIGAWLVNLAKQFPSLAGGPAYWSITPALGNETFQDAAIPIGFDADTSYLGGARRRLADAIMAVPSCLSRTHSLDTFRHQTLLHLLHCRELRLISIWHPSFLSLLLDELPLRWDRLLDELEHGIGMFPADTARAGELRFLGPLKPEMLWPKLQVISCWGDGAAEAPLKDLRECFPNVFFQRKGLIATEAFMTLPFRGQFPLAVRSHFFEFLDEQGRAHCVEDLRDGEDYEIIVSTAGGLWRYRIGDRVRVAGWLAKTPSLRFLGRGESVSDRFGEKLTEQFVAEILRDIFGSETPRFALLAPDENEGGSRYTLYVEGRVSVRCATDIEQALRRNPHYAYCRDLGQLLPAGIFLISDRGYETYAKRQLRQGARLGGVKPAVLSRTSGWSEIFCGTYLRKDEKSTIPVRE